MYNISMKHWTELTEYEFCLHRELTGNNIEEKVCAHCWFVSKCWTDDFGVYLCISCSHDYYSDTSPEIGEIHGLPTRIRTEISWVKAKRPKPLDDGKL